MPETTTISTHETITQLLAVLREAFEGPDRFSYFTDMTPDSGLLHTLGPITADEACRTVGGTSVAAHARHILFGLRSSTSWIEGDHARRNWRESWNTNPVDEPEWNDIREGILSAYSGLREAIEQHAGDSAESLGGALGAVTHVAYHLGAIRAKMVCGREE
ncbi:MAG: hypothetical protein ACYC9O_08075 [Candidatus Latescibacterota bacterium]